MRAAIEVEWLKLRHAPVTWVTTLLVGLGVPGLAAAFVYAAAHASADSHLAAKVGPMLVGESWPEYLGLVGQMLSVAGLLGFGVVFAWSFGREFADGTVTSFYALPVSRSSVAGAKLVVVAVWSSAVCTAVPVVALGAGWLAGLGAPGAVALPGLVKATIVGLLTVGLALPLAYVASAGRGLLPGFAALLLIVVITQVATLAGSGAWFPYAAPGMWSGAAGSDLAASVRPAQLALVPVVAGLGAWATIRWWRSAQVV